MSQDKPVLSREQIRQHCVCLKDVVGDLFPSIDDPSREYYWELIDELGKMALIALDRPLWKPVKDVPLPDFDSLASPHNDHEPPQVVAIDVSASKVAGPASGSPDALTKLIEDAPPGAFGKATSADTPLLSDLHCAKGGAYTENYTRVLCGRAEEALCALEAELRNRPVISGLRYSEYESLQHQLAQRGEWLKDSLNACEIFAQGLLKIFPELLKDDPAMAEHVKTVATIRKALGETT